MAGDHDWSPRNLPEYLNMWVSFFGGDISLNIIKCDLEKFLFQNQKITLPHN